MKRIHIAVVGVRSSGKSYLLYDMIHAFEQLGYQPEELPLSYPHSSFGTYFYDTFNNATGGMRGTDRYACRPENHYGAYMRRGALHDTLAVDFLNIPGEVFDRTSNRMSDYFELKRQIEKKGKGLFWLQTWRSPSGHVLKFVVPPGFRIDSNEPMKPDRRNRYGNYMQWSHIAYELKEGSYVFESLKRVSGRYVLQHLTELHTDSFLLTVEQVWPQLTNQRHLDLDDYKAKLVLHYFYPLHFCEAATDIIVCDKLTDDQNAGALTEAVAHYMDLNRRHNPHVYLAFRGTDLLLDGYEPFADRTRAAELAKKPYLRNTLYSEVMQRLTTLLHQEGESHDGLHLPNEWRRHIQQTTGSGIGQAFWHLLNASVSYNMLKRLQHAVRGTKSVDALSKEPGHPLPPHVYFTATPIDTQLRIYKSDPSDVTRFYCEEGGHVEAFNQAIRRGKCKHLCFGSYQLLTDLLWQNGISTSGMKERDEQLRYTQSKL